MACHFVSEQDMIDYTSSSHFKSDVDSLSDDKSSNQTFQQPILCQSESQFSESDSINNKIKLPRGGCQVITKVGSIQFSIVPETLKDSINLGLEVPSIFIVPQHRFDKRFCLSVAEFEFPAYFSFFIKKKKVTLITDQEGEVAIRNIFQETLLGPADLSNFKEDFNEYYKGRPDMRRELDHFARNPFNPSEPLTVDTLINFVLFNKQGVADLGQDVTVRQEKNRIYIFEGQKQLAKIKNKIDIMIDDKNAESYMKYGLFTNPTDKYQVEHYQEQIFEPPVFGVTVMGCSHGFDPKGSVSGYIFWINGLGIMLDPPPFTTLFLKKQGIPSRLVRWVIISHNHADHDAGTFQKLLESEKTILITTNTIKNSFVRKYAAMTGYQNQYIESLFNFERVVIGNKLKINGAEFEFHYSLHSIPCLSFILTLNEKSIYFSGDTFYEPNGLKTLQEKGVLSEERYNQLMSEDKWKCDLILHEAGVPPIHTPSKVLAQLPDAVKKNLRLIHAAAKDIPTDSGLQMPTTGFKDTLVLIRSVVNDRLKIIQQLNLLENIDLFKSATIKQIREIFESVKVVHYLPQTQICVEDEIGNDFFVIQKGTVKIDSNNKDYQFTKYLHYGDYFGEGCFFGQSKRRANATSMTLCELLILDKFDFLKIFSNGSNVMQKLEQLQGVRDHAQIIEKNKFFQQLSSNQKIQFEFLLQQKKFFPRKSLIQSFGILASVSFFVFSGKIQVILPSDFVVQQFEGLPLKMTQQSVEEGNKKRKRFSLPVNASLEFHQRAQSPQKSDNGRNPQVKQFILTAGQFFGEIDAIMNQKRTNTIVEALEDTELIMIDAESLKSFLRNNPGLLVLFQDSIIIE